VGAAPLLVGVIGTHCFYWWLCLNLKY